MSINKLNQLIEALVNPNKEQDNKNLLFLFIENIFLYDMLYEIYHLHKSCQGKENVFRKQCFLQYLPVRNFLFHISVQQKDGYHQLFRDSENGYESVECMTVKENLCKKLCAKERIDWNPRLLVAARHCKIFVEKMERPIHCEVTEQDLLIIEKLQEIMKKKLGRKGIVVEVNPSSNTAIADLEILGDNQFYQLNQSNSDENVIVCINSDDPAVFNTNVSNELAYIYYGMLEKGISREMALLWIERIQKNGMNSSFIRKEVDNQLIKY